MSEISQELFKKDQTLYFLEQNLLISRARINEGSMSSNTFCAQIAFRKPERSITTRGCAWTPDSTN